MMTLSLGYNQLSGSIPAALGNLESLVALDLSNNKLTGIVPEAVLALPRLALADIDRHLYDPSAEQQLVGYPA